MDAILKAYKDLQNEVVPAYKAEIVNADQQMADALVKADGGEIVISIETYCTVMQTLQDMNTAVYMLEQHLKGSIAALEVAQTIKR